MEITSEKKLRKPRTRHTPEFLALRRKVRGQGIENNPPPAKGPTKKEKAMALGELEGEPPPATPTEKHFRHSMTRDKRTQEWRVRVPTPKGRTRYVTTGETEVKAALKVVDASGVPQLSVLARARCLTQNAAAIIVAGGGKTCEDVAAVWMRDLKLDQSKATCAMYGIYIQLLFRTYDCARKPPSFITRQMLYDFVNKQDLKHSTRRLRLAAISSFYCHAAGFAHVTGNIASTIKINLNNMTIEQREQVSAVPITEAEYRKIMAAHEIPRFWRVATALGYWLGLRMVDVCKLERASIGEDFAVLYPHKTGRRLVLPIHDPLIGSGELRELFRLLLAATPVDQVLCFPAQSKMYDASPAVLSQDYREELVGIGIVGKTFHGLRHAFKVRLMASGKAIEEVQRYMGHASVTTTEGYGRVSA